MKKRKKIRKNKRKKRKTKYAGYNDGADDRTENRTGKLIRVSKQKTIKTDLKAPVTA